MRREQGVAIVSVLLIVVLASALAYHLVSRQEISIASTRANLDLAQAKQFALGAEEIAKSVLISNASRTTYDHLDEDWAQILTPFEMQDGTVVIRIVDLNSKLNLNSLGKRESRGLWEVFNEMCDTLSLDRKLIPRWIDWIDGDQQTTPGGQEDYDLLIASPATRTPDVPGFSISEVNILAPLDLSLLLELQALTDVLPTTELKLNVNTLNPTVAALFNSELDKLEFLQRQFSTVEQAITTIPELSDLAEYLSVTSDFFEVQVIVNLGDTRFDLTSRMYVDRTTDLNKVFVQTYSRDYSQRHNWTSEISS